MVSVDPTMPGQPAEQTTSLPSPVDPVRRVVHLVLCLYLMPVILLVAAIGLIGIVVERLATGLRAFVRAIAPGKVGETRPGITVKDRVIGVRPVSVWNRRRSRVIR
jgi:hypothetical protein